MYSTTLILYATLGLAAAQTTTLTARTASSTAVMSGCGLSIDLIIQNCLGTEHAFLSSCAANDWDCLCQGSTYVSQCYANCPTDPLAFGAQQTQTSYCNAAKVYGSAASSTMASTLAVAASTTSSRSGSSMTATHIGASRGSSEPSASTDAKTKASPSTVANAAMGSCVSGVPAWLAAGCALAALV